MSKDLIERLREEEWSEAADRIEQLEAELAERYEQINSLMAEVARLQANALKAQAQEPVARYYGSEMSRYCIEWLNGPLPEGTLFFTHPPADRDAILQAITDPENQPSQFGTVTLDYMAERQLDLATKYSDAVDQLVALKAQSEPTITASASDLLVLGAGLGAYCVEEAPPPRAEDAKDAARYRHWCEHYEENFGVALTKEEIDRLTDAARGEG